MHFVSISKTSFGVGGGTTTSGICVPPPMQRTYCNEIKIWLVLHLGFHRVGFGVKFCNFKMDSDLTLLVFPYELLTLVASLRNE